MQIAQETSELIHRVVVIEVRFATLGIEGLATNSTAKSEKKCEVPKTQTPSFCTMLQSDEPNLRPILLHPLTLIASVTETLG